MKAKLFLSLYCLLTWVIPGQSQNEVLQSLIDRTLDDNIFEHANASVCIAEVESGAILAGHRAHKVLVPASSLKLFTSFCGLVYLGPEYRFKTSLEYDGALKDDGTLEGNIYIKGGGDPTLGSNRFDSVLDFDDLMNDMYNAIRKAGINCIKGNIIADESVFDSYPVAPSWQWNDLGNYYASGAWGLNINENQYFVHFGNREIIGALAEIKKVYPSVKGLKLSNEVTIDSSHTGDQAYIFGGPYNFGKRIVGTIPQGKGLFTIKGSIPDPPEFAAERLSIKLDKENVQSSGVSTLYRENKSARSLIKEYSSPSLKDIVAKTNISSLNLHSECILKMIGLNERGQGSGQNGIAAIKSKLRFYGIDPEVLHIEDGSGLSARNLISSASMALFLAEITQEINLEILLETLAIGGYNGTVGNMFNKSGARGNVWLKSGSMTGIQSYSGYIKAKSGKWLSFSVIINGFSAKGSIVRRKLNDLIAEIYESG
ncbi:MAG: D-alanyl-D-alanine carboxypeptidase/D-alanyl-D-alanine-endopeptidase [Saprospiraceae bacterium]|nr:D-alanyl-D-alanine carboxypeptidase/D-alanyl-D-alanine-endopeptidase [Saprospiraceae bacterium]